MQRLAVELADEITSDKDVSARCRALPAKLFSPEAAVKQIAAALGGIDWPHGGVAPLLSGKDQAGKFFKDAEVFE